MPGRWENDSHGKRAVIVFVHGILSSAETGWTNSHGKTWPSLLEESLRDKSVGIYAYSYSTKFSSGDFGINDIADTMDAELQLDGITKFPLIIFVCHSMGGIVVRRFLVQRQHEYQQHRFALFLVASPSRGADYANWLAPIINLAGHAQASALQIASGNPWLSTLDADFSRLIQNRSIKGREIVEDRSIFPFWFFFRKRVVDPMQGAVHFPEPLRIAESNHFTIAKPEEAAALQHRLLCQFILDVLDAETPQIDPVLEGQAPLITGPAASVADVQQLIIHASPEVKASLVARIPYGPAVRISRVGQDIVRSFSNALNSSAALALVASASGIVLAADPQYEAQPELISVTQGELPEILAAPYDIVWAAFQRSALKGPRMLTALLLFAPQQAVHAAGNSIVKLLRELGTEV